MPVSLIDLFVGPIFRHEQFFFHLLLCEFCWSMQIDANFHIGYPYPRMEECMALVIIIGTQLNWVCITIFISGICPGLDIPMFQSIRLINLVNKPFIGRTFLYWPQHFQLCLNCYQYPDNDTTPTFSSTVLYPYLALYIIIQPLSPYFHILYFANIY